MVLVINIFSSITHTNKHIKEEFSLMVNRRKKMKERLMIQGAAYIGPYSEFGWIPTLAVIVIGIFLFWFLYKLVLCHIKDGDNKKEEKVIPIVREPKGPEVDENGITKLAPKEEMVVADEEIIMPMSGRLMPISEVPDPIFAEKMVGDGFAIEPYKEDIYAPVSGRVMQIYSNKDALTFMTPAGREVILHIGINTMDLKGEGIIFHVKEGEQVKAGDHIGRIDLEKVVPLIKSVISPIVFTNLKQEKIVIKQEGIVEAGMRECVVIKEEEE